MILVKALPDMTGAVVMQFDRPGRARNRVGKFCAGPDVVDGQLLAADDPAGLADAGKTIGADPRRAKTLREFGAQEGNRAIGLFLAVQSRCDASIGSSGVSTWVMFIAATPRPGMMKARPSRRTSP